MNTTKNERSRMDTQEDVMRKVTLPGRPETRIALRGFLIALVVAQLIPAAAFGATLSHTYSRGWNLVTVPLYPVDPDPAAVFDEVPGTLEITDEFGGHVIGASEPGFRTIEPGIGHWILFPADTTVFVTGNEPTTAVEFRTNIHPGWNVIGSPWNRRVSWEDSRILFSDGSQTVPLSQAVTLGWVDGTVVTYDPTNESYLTISPNLGQKLLSWVGFELHSTITGELIFVEPPPDLTPPDVELLQPTEGFDFGDADEIRTLTPVIGTASDDNLRDWTLEFESLELGTRTVVATGDTSVTASFLSNLDPTLLLNGIGTLHLTAFDEDGNWGTDQATVVIGGDNKLGNFRLTFIDLEVPFAGIPISIRRTYDTRRRNTPRDFGYGWQLEVVAAGKYLRNRKPGDGWGIVTQTGECVGTDELLNHVVEIRFSDREFYRFGFEPVVPAIGTTLPCLADGRFVLIGGVPGASLEDLNYPEAIYPDGVPLIHDGGSAWLEEEDLNLPVYDPRHVRLTTIDGTKYDLSLVAQGTQPKGLYRIEDRNGNILDIATDSVTWSNPTNDPLASKSIQIVRDALGRVEKLIDPELKEIPYTYDAANNLETVSDRTQNTTTFVYDASHFLTEIIDPLSNKPIRPQFDSEGRLIAWLDADGKETKFVTDAAANSIVVTDRELDSTTYQYGLDGYLKDTIQPGNITTSYTYDVRGNVLTETDPLNNTTTYTYDLNDQLTSVTDPENNITTYEYLDPTNPEKVTKIIQPELNFTENVYDPATGNLLREIDGVGKVRDMTYNDLGKVETETLFYDSALGYDPQNPLPAHGQTSFEYDTFGNLFRRTDALGNVVEYSHDGNHRQLTETVYRTINPHASPASQIVEAEVTTMVYDAQGRLRFRTDAEGHTWETQYDAAGRVQYQIDPLLRMTEMVYDARNNLAERIDPDGLKETYGYDLEGRRTTVVDRFQDPLRRTDFEYDALGRLFRTTYADNAVEETEYDDAGRVVKRFDPRFTNKTVFTEMQYDKAGRLRFTIDPLGHVTENQYDGNGRLVKVIDANLHETTFTYDTANRREKTIFHDSTFTQTFYDDAGRSVGQQDQNSKVTNYGYDPLGRLTSVTTPMSHTWNYGYDESGNLITQTDANTNSTRMTYDGNGRLLSRTLPLGQTESFTYTKTGQRDTRTDFNGVTTSYSYDDLDRLEDVFYPSGNPSTADVHYSYTETSQRKTMTDGVGLTTYIYDVRDRLESITDPFGRTISYDYDLAGNRTEVTVPSGTTTYGYDHRNMMETVLAAGDATPFVYGYDPVGFKTSMSYPNGVVATFTPDDLNRLTSIEHRKSTGEVIASFVYTLDNVGNRTAVQEVDRAVTWGYDDEYKLTSETIQVTGQPATVIGFGYDDVGNRLVRTDDGAVSQSFVYDDNDRIVTLNGVTFDFDANGNQLGDPLQGHVYGWDLENRLTSVTGPGLSLANEYGGHGMRMRSVQDGVPTEYVMDPNTAYYRVLEERVGSGTLDVAYTYGHALLKQSIGPSFYHGDAVGSSRALTGSQQSQTSLYAYEAFGALVSGSGSTPNKYRFAGEEEIDGLDLYNLRARFYGPGTGRLLAVDPLDSPTSPTVVPVGKQRPVISVPSDRRANTYSYALNRPVTMADASGMQAEYFAAMGDIIGNLVGAVLGTAYAAQAAPSPGWYAVLYYDKWYKQWTPTHEAIGYIDANMDFGQVMEINIGQSNPTLGAPTSIIARQEGYTPKYAHRLGTGAGAPVPTLPRDPRFYQGVQNECLQCTTFAQTAMFPYLEASYVSQVQGLSRANCTAPGYEIPFPDLFDRWNQQGYAYKKLDDLGLQDVTW